MLFSTQSSGAVTLPEREPKHHACMMHDETMNVHLVRVLYINIASAGIADVNLSKHANIIEVGSVP